MPHPLFLVVSVLHLFSTVRVVGGFFFSTSPYAVSVIVPQSGGGCYGRGLLQAGRGSRSTAPSVRLACFRAFSCQ